MQATFEDRKVFFNVIMSGVIAVYNGDTNSNNLYEIPMSQSNHTASGRLVKFATCSQSGNSITSRVKLQVKCEGASNPNPVVITFKFRRMI